jgi:hypothetical protein
MRWLVLYRHKDSDPEADPSPHHLILVMPDLPFIVPLLLLVLLLLLLLWLLLLLLLLPPQAVLLLKNKM